VVIVKSIRNITDEPIFINGVEIGAHSFAYSFYSRDLFSNNGGDASEHLTRGHIELYDGNNNLIEPPNDFPALNETTDYINNLGVYNSSGQKNIVEISSDTQLNGLEEFVKVDTLLGGITLTLPGLTGTGEEFLGKELSFKNFKGNNDLIVNGFGSELIDGQTSIILNPGIASSLISDGSSWESTGVFCLWGQQVWSR